MSVEVETFVMKVSLRYRMDRMFTKFIIRNWSPSCIWKWQYNQQLIIRGK